MSLLWVALYKIIEKHWPRARRVVFHSIVSFESGWAYLQEASTM